MVRALNDNMASIVYNKSGELTQFFYIGLGVSVFSLICAIIMTQIHKNVIEKKGIK